VWWSQVNSANACQPGTDIYTQWSNPMGMCDANNNFVFPAAVMAIQATTILAVIFSFFTCSIGYSITGSKQGGGYGAAVSALLAMIFSICAFALWTTWNLSMQLQSSTGYPVPLWTTTANVLQPSKPVRMWYGAVRLRACAAQQQKKLTRARAAAQSYVLSAFISAARR